MYWFVYEWCKDYTYLDIIMSLPYVVSLLMHRGSQMVTLWAAESQMKLAEVMAARQMVLDLGHVIPNDKWDWNRDRHEFLMCFRGQHACAHLDIHVPRLSHPETLKPI